MWAGQYVTILFLNAASNQIDDITVFLGRYRATQCQRTGANLLSGFALYQFSLLFPFKHPVILYVEKSIRNARVQLIQLRS